MCCDAQMEESSVASASLSSSSQLGHLILLACCHHLCSWMPWMVFKQGLEQIRAFMAWPSWSKAAKGSKLNLSPPGFEVLMVSLCWDETWSALLLPTQPSNSVFFLLKKKKHTTTTRKKHSIYSTLLRWVKCSLSVFKLVVATGCLSGPTHS